MKTVDRLAKLFTGLDRAYGVFTVGEVSDSGKLNGRGFTKQAPLTTSLWEKHLAGEQGLGIIAITDDATCHWACIDIDDHTINLPHLEKRAKELGLPVVICRSKSGGAHVFLFLKRPASARTVRDYLCAWSAWLGYGGCEVFPKQVKLAGKEDVGNWLNMPYFDVDRTTRYAYQDGKAVLDLSKFLTMAEDARVDIEDLAKIKQTETAGLEDGPPCLQMLVQQGFGEGQRNDGLFSLGVYCRLRWPDRWQDKLEEMNHKFMTPPLKSSEVQGLIKSLDRKGYHYRCNEPPLRPLCNKTACLKCRYGVGNDDDAVQVTIGGLTKIETHPPQWIIEVDGHRMMVSTRDMLDQRAIQRQCVEHLHVLPTLMKANRWQKKVNELLQNVEIIEGPSDAGPEGRMLEYLFEFCDNKRISTERSDLLYNKVWHDTQTDRLHFRGPAFIKYLERQGFKELKDHQIYAALRFNKEIDARHSKTTVQQKLIAYWSIKVLTNLDSAPAVEPALPKEKF